MESVGDETSVISKQCSTEEKIMLPSYKRTWTSHDNTAQKTVVKEGNIKQSRPRFGATGEIELKLHRVSGIPSEINPKTDISKYFFVDSPVVNFEIGSAKTPVDRAFETALQEFLPGETSVLKFNVFIENKYNTKNKDAEEPYWITIESEIHLKCLFNAEPLYRWYPETKMNKAKEMYVEGVELFKAGRFLDAFHFFQWSYKLSVFTVGVPKTSKYPGDDVDLLVLSEAQKLQINTCNNLAACHFQWNHYKSVVELSKIVLLKDPKMVKALYRRGVSYLGLNEYDLAEKDLVTAYKVEPSNRAVNEKLGQVKQKKKAAQAEMSKNLSKMFT